MVDFDVHRSHTRASPVYLSNFRAFPPIWLIRIELVVEDALEKVDGEMHLALCPRLRLTL